MVVLNKQSGMRTLIILAWLILTGCVNAQEEFVLGADMSYLTEMEDKGAVFYGTDGTEKECMRIMSDLGCQAMRLRVWVNPENHYCGLEDVVLKAKRAVALGMKLMIDFHYSDTWADPGQQNRPAAWQNYSVSQLCAAVANHTKEVLNRLKEEGLAVTWVQVGNETTNGMFYPTGQQSAGGSVNYAQFFNAGAQAAKDVFPDCKIIMHINPGDDNTTAQWSLDEAKKAGAEWDIIGLSLYFNWTDNVTAQNSWETVKTKCVNNVKALVSRYGTPVMLAEVGMNHWDKQDKNILGVLRRELEAINGCCGAFYWEPEQYAGWQGNSMGAFVQGNTPSEYLVDFYKHDASDIDGVMLRGRVPTDDIYTLSGMRMKHHPTFPIGGIYISNGKSILVKPSR